MLLINLFRLFCELFHDYDFTTHLNKVDLYYKMFCNLSVLYQTTYIKMTNFYGTCSKLNTVLITMGEIEDIQSLEKLLERRSHELKTMRALVKQKDEETKKYFAICGDNPNFSVLKDVLSTKLTDLETELAEARKRVRNLRQKRQVLTESKTKAGEINQSIQESNEQIKNIKSLIEQKTKETDALQKILDEKSEVCKQKQSEVDTLRAKVAETQQIRDNATNELNSLIERERSLTAQQQNIRQASQATKQQIDEIKGSISNQTLFDLKQEIKTLQKQLDESGVESVESFSVTSVDDLDPVYKTQLESVSQRVQQLKTAIQSLRSDIESDERSHSISMAELRAKLENQKQANNILRSSIEETELQLPSTLGPINREIEQWRAKVDSAAKEAQENEKALSEKREESERALKESEKRLEKLQDELLRAKAITGQQKENCIAQERDIERLKRELAASEAQLLSLSDETKRYESETKDVQLKIQQTDDENRRLSSILTEEERKSEETLSVLRQSVEAAEAEAAKMPESEITVGVMNEKEIKESIKSLERDLAERENRVRELRTKCEESQKTRKKFEAALSLIAELEEEEQAMIGELKMIRKQFAETLNSLRNQKK